MRKIQEAKIEGQKVLLRVDYNVPLGKSTANGLPTTEIESDKRIRESLPTIQYLLDHGATEIIIMTHLGKPEGKADPTYSLWPIANRLAELLKIDIKFNEPADEYRLSDSIIMLENLRFNKGEEENATGYINNLANKGSLYINDAFGTCHRAHASTEGLAKVLPAYAGLLVQKEVARLEELLQSKEKPFTVILGGAKIADKLPVIKNLTSRADNFLIGGAIANTFLAGRRYQMGKSLVEKESIGDANQIWQDLMDDSHRNLYLPSDLVLSKSVEKADDLREIEIGDLMQDKYPGHDVVDIGHKTIEQFREVIQKSKTVFWNGNMGVSEVPDFAQGTEEIAEAISKFEGQAVIGGGDTVAAVEKVISNSLSVISIDNNTNKQSLTAKALNQLPITNNLFLSTGGGATLEFLAGKELPGLKALE